MRAGGALMLFLLLVLPAGAQKPFYESQLLFPPERWHNHGSCIVELPNGDLLVCWYNGSGERTADDVKVEGMRKRKGARTWSGRFLMADTIGFPDCNPCMFVDPQGRLWLMWVAIIANRWETALLRYQISDNPRGTGAPRWTHSDILILKPGDEFAQIVAKQCDEDEKRIDQILPPERREEGLAYLAERRKNAADKYFRRMGWMTRVHPFVLDGKRIIVPLYSDGFDFSIMAISDDGGKTWQASRPLVSFGGVQPSLVQKRDGTLVAYMRDNGPPPQRVMRSESRDGGMTWSPVVDDNIPNPGSGLEVIRLQNGHWVMVCNDTEQGRHRLAVLISDDEGKSWKWKRYLENDPPGAGSYSYPSVIQAKDGTLHVTYSWSQPGKGSCIKYAHFSEEWVLRGD
ncbi:Sialidase [bacterium HR16]|nr:Sialidase [bacterium HR16]